VYTPAGKEKKDKNEKKAAFSSATSKDKKEGKQKLQANKEEVCYHSTVLLSSNMCYREQGIKT